MNAKIGKRILAIVLTLGLTLSMLPTTAFAATGDGSSGPVGGSDSSGLVLNKTATLEDNGTYTINLEAFATGETQTITVQEPTDIVLVLDVSGSMDDNITYTTGYDWQFTTKKVKDMPTDVYHKCPDGTYSTVTWNREGTFNTTYRYVCDNCKATRKWSVPLNNQIPGTGSNDPWNLYEYSPVTKEISKIDALKNAAKNFVSAVETKNQTTDEQHRVSIVKFASENINNTVGNDTYESGNYTYNYTQVVDNLTAVDAAGASKLNSDIDALNAGGATAADKGLSLAQNVLTNQSDGNRKQVVVLFTDGSPTYGNKFENAVASSAVTTAKTLKDAGVTVYTIGVFSDANASDTSADTNKYMNAVSSNYPDATVTDSNSFSVNLGSGGDNGYYKVFTDAAQLNNIFTEISENIGSTKVQLDDKAVVKDIMADGFTLTADSQATAEVVAYSGRDKDGNRVFEESGTSIYADISGNTVAVTGFNFAADYLLDGDNIVDNDFRPAKQGKKLCITITGVEATDEAITNNITSTNAVVSGIYADVNASTAAAVFPQPKTMLSSKVYVLDYAKEAALSDMPNNVTHIAKGMNGFAAANTALAMTYGKATLNTYKPVTTNWNGYDSFYGFGKWNTKPEGVTTGDNTWTKVSVLPANNVYYEDTFTTANGASVGIEYSTDGWETVTEGSNTGNTNDDEHGWITSMDDDNTYSDGTVATGSKGATATFTFTGTGVDIYSHTNMTTGLVVARLYKGDQVVKANLTKSLTVDNLAQSGDYYQIPTVSFNEPDHGTYTVKLTVVATSNVTGTERSTYYLDGIRVYNPLSEKQEEDDIVVEAYGDEIGAAFQNVRDILLEAESFDSEADQIEGAVFIDYNPVNDKTEDTAATAAIGTYEDYGPKNEVYLAKDQAIAVRIGTSVKKVSVGLKAPDGATTAQITNGENTSSVEINAASDQYFAIAPNTNGYVIIKNTGDHLLSVTKLKLSGESTEPVMLSMDTDVMMTYANSFDSLPVVAYTLRNEELPEESEETITDPGEESEGGTVIIENPEESEQEDTSGTDLSSWLSDLFKHIKEIFRP